MKTVIDFVKRLFSKDAAKPIGRWNVENCSARIKNKIDLSNMDHCGPCGQNSIDYKSDRTVVDAVHPRRSLSTLTEVPCAFSKDARM